MDSLITKYLAFIIKIFILAIYISNKLIADTASYPINSPYTKEQVQQNTLFSNFHEPPKHLDPVKSYSSDEYLFIAQIYEPIYEYHYLLRPYQLVPLMAEDYVTEEYYDFNNQKLSNKAQLENINYTVYTIKIKKNILYQPHPAFAQDKDNQYIYHDLDKNFIVQLDGIKDFDYKISNKIITNSRELVANDFIYQIKRIADPKNQSPIYSFMANYIIGFSDLNKKLTDYRRNNKNFIYVNLNNYHIEGLNLIDKYTYQIKIKGKYPQFKYWLAMLFFAPMPWEADLFYSQDGLAKQNISLDTFPVGTGPYMLVDSNPNRKMVLEKNPNYKHGFYPAQGMPDDESKGLLNNAGKPLPFIDKVEFYLEKESIPIWNKFLQGYYDSAGISSDNFDQAIELINNKLGLSKEMQEKNIKLVTDVEPTVFYWAFNMLDEVVGGYAENQRKLRQAIAIAFDVEEYINIFRNGRGVLSHSPIPLGIMPDIYNSTLNKHVYNSEDNKKTIKEAKKLLEQAGYKNGINPKTGSPLVINFDIISSGDPSEGSVFNWMREQFNKINLKLNIRATQYNRFRDKISQGHAQMFLWAWHADYPDAENFLFLFLCNQSKVKFNGENASNYCRKDFDDLFNKMQSTNLESERYMYIQKMVAILQYDAPWIFGYYNELFQLKHGWLNISKPLTVGNNNLKYLSLNFEDRLKQQLAWNQPVWWPVFLMIFISLLFIAPVSISYYRKIHKPKVRI